MSLSVVTAAATENWSHIKAYVCQARGKNYCLIHKRYFDISWCPECGKSECIIHWMNPSWMTCIKILFTSVLISIFWAAVSLCICNKHSSFPFYTVVSTTTTSSAVAFHTVIILSSLSHAVHVHKPFSWIINMMVYVMPSCILAHSWNDLAFSPFYMWQIYIYLVCVCIYVYINF